MSLGSAFADDPGLLSNSEITPIVFVVDEDISVREALELLIRSEGWRPEMFNSAQEFLACPRAQVPSCLVLDVARPGRNSLELQKRIASERHEVPIIFVTDQSDVRTTVQAMKAGAVEFLTKPFNIDLLMGAIREGLARSRAALDREIETRELQSRYASLTRRERQVMECVTSGFTNRLVGRELGISEITVKAHRGNVMKKMNADSLPDLVRMVARLHVQRSACRLRLVNPIRKASVEDTR